MKIKKKNVEIIIVLVYVILLHFDFIIIERIKYLFFVLGIYMTYIYILKKISNYYQNIDIFREVKNEEFDAYAKELNVYAEKSKKELKILIMIYKYKNYLIFILIKIRLKMFFFLRRMNKIIKYKKIKKVIIWIIGGILFMPLELILYLYYYIIKNFKENTFMEIVFKSIQGLIISILLLTNIIDYIKDIIEEKGYIIIIVYIISCIILNIIGHIRLLQYFGIGLINIQDIIEIRIEVTILGVIILEKIRILEKIDKIQMLKYDIKQKFIEELNSLIDS